MYFNKNYFFSSLKTTILAIFYIITSPFSLSLIQYFYQDKLRNYDNVFSILIIISTLFCLLFIFFQETFIKKTNLYIKYHVKLFNIDTDICNTLSITPSHLSKEF